jgi:small GTP-binding protein
MSETKIRLDCYLNNGKKEAGRRVVLNSRWHWKTCLKKVADKFGEECGEESLLYSEDGIPIEEVDEVREGETVFFASKGEAFVKPSSGGGESGQSNQQGGQSDPLRPSSPEVPPSGLTMSGNLAAPSDSTFVYLIKFILVGNASVGKSCLLLQFTDNKFVNDMDPTIGVDFGSRVISVGGQNVKVQAWDTAGQEDFRAITRAYYREAAAALICYDICDRRSFRKLKSWLSAVRGNATNSNLSITLVGCVVCRVSCSVLCEHCS